MRVGGPEYLLLLEEDRDERVDKVGEVVHDGLSRESSVIGDQSVWSEGLLLIGSARASPY